VSEERLRDLFGRFGQIEKVRMLPQKGCAFVNFMHMDAAVTAKSQMNGMIVGDKPMKINFGKDTAPEEKKPQMDLFAPVIKDNEPPPQFDPPPPDALPPNDPALRTVIDKMAEYVAKNGRTFEMVALEKNKDNPKFGFLREDNPLNGYYKLKLWCSEHPAISPAEYRQRMDEYNRALEQKALYTAVPPPPINEPDQVNNNNYKINSL
jgi:RNA recognition motif-containing protein